MQAVKVVASATSMKRKAIYLLALEKFGNQVSKEKDWSKMAEFHGNSCNDRKTHRWLVISPEQNLRSLSRFHYLNPFLHANHLLKSCCLSELTGSRKQYKIRCNRILIRLLFLNAPFMYISLILECCSVYFITISLCWLKFSYCYLCIFSTFTWISWFRNKSTRSVTK